MNVFDLGETEDGSLYIAMELVDGISLAELLKKEGRRHASVGGYEALHLFEPVLDHHYLAFARYRRLSI